MVHDHVVPHDSFGRGGESGCFLDFLLVIAFLVFFELLFRPESESEKHSDEEYNGYDDQKEIFHENLD